MSVVSSLLGGGNNGAGFQAQAAPLQTPTTIKQADTAYQQSQDALAKQAAFANAVNAQTPGALNAQSFLTNQLTTQAKGGGPSPASDMLNNATGANVANQAALAAGVRGAGANTGLIARQVGQQGAGIQQNAIGQTAVLKSNEQIAAENALAGVAGTQVGQSAAATNANNQAVQSEQQNILNAIQGQNTAEVGSTSSQNSSNAAIAGVNAQGQQGLIGGVLGGVGSIFQSKFKGGVVENYAGGGSVVPSLDVDTSMPMSNAGKFLFSSAPSNKAAPAPIFSGMGGDSKTGAGQLNSGLASALKAGLSAVFAKGGPVKAMVSPGEQLLSPQEAKKVAAGKVNPLKVGERVPGKPKVKGDSIQNDVVPKTLESGGVVIPNHIMQSDNPPKNAQKFVAAIMAKQSAKR